MSIYTFLVRPVTIQTPTATIDRYNNTIDVWSSPASRDAKAWVAQTNTNENQDHRSEVSTTIHATFEVSAGLTAGERVVIDGKTYELTGEPNIAWTPRGPHHVEADLVAVVG